MCPTAEQQADDGFEGGCTCGGVRYRMESPPLIVHCCHCRWCQRETGASFALNALVESERLHVLEGQPESVPTPSQSGKGQNVWRCPTCRVALWSNYAGFGAAVSFVRAGTLDRADRVTPDIHIFTDSKQPWVVIPKGQAAVSEFYRLKEYWSDDSRARLRRVLEKQRG